MVNPRLTIPLSTTLSLVIFMTACTTTYEPPVVADKLIWTSDGEGSRPMWTLAPAAIKDSADQAIRVVGMSNRHSTQKGARDAAMDDARRQIANYFSSQVEDKVERIESGANTQSGIQDPVQELNRITRQLSVHAVNSMTVENSRFEQWLDSRTGKTFFNAFVQATMPMNSLHVGRSGELESMRRLEEGE